MPKQESAGKTEAESSRGAAKGESSATKTGRWQRVVDLALSRRGLAMLILFSLLSHACGIAYVSFGSSQRGSEPSLEIPVGRFHFSDSEPDASGILAAEFSVHIELLSGVEQRARDRLRARHQRVQQTIEELLREAEGTDFADPTLAVIKRHVQDRINRIIELKAVDDVIITGLTLVRGSDRSLPPPTEAVGAVTGRRNPAR